MTTAPESINADAAELTALRRAESAPLEAAHITELQAARRAASRRYQTAKEIHGRQSAHTIAAREAHNAISAEIQRRGTAPPADDILADAWNAAVNEAAEMTTAELVAIVDGNTGGRIVAAASAELEERRDLEATRESRPTSDELAGDSIAGSHAEEEAQRLALEAEQRAELAAELEQQDRENVTTAARDTIAAIGELEELRELADVALHALTREETRLEAKLNRLEAVKRPKYESLHAHELADCRRGLEATTRALAIARKHSPTRRAILAKALPNG